MEVHVGASVSIWRSLDGAGRFFGSKAASAAALAQRRTPVNLFPGVTWDADEATPEGALAAIVAAHGEGCAWAVADCPGELLLDILRFEAEALGIPLDSNEGVAHFTSAPRS